MYLVSVAAYWAPVRYCNRYPGLDHPSLRKNGATRGARSAPGLDSFALSGAGVSKRQALFFGRAFLGAIVTQGLNPSKPKPGLPGAPVRTWAKLVRALRRWSVEALERRSSSRFSQLPTSKTLNPTKPLQKDPSPVGGDTACLQTVVYSRRNGKNLRYEIA